MTTTNVNRELRIESLTHHRQLRALKVFLGESTETELATLRAIEDHLVEALGYLPELIVTVSDGNGDVVDEFQVAGPTTGRAAEGVLNYWDGENVRFDVQPVLLGEEE